jgi:predicted amidohydrolase
VAARGGEVVFRARKQLLPSYDVFDETRYFEPGPPSGLYQVGGLTLAVTICEDVWHHEIGEYDVAPVEELFAAAGAAGTTIDALINLSLAIQRSKEKTEIHLQAICRPTRCPFYAARSWSGFPF